MSGADFLQLAAIIALALIGVAMALILTALRPRADARRPYPVPRHDRTMLAASGIGIFAIRTGLFLYTDIAIALGLVGFLSTAAFARYLISRNPGEGA